MTELCRDSVKEPQVIEYSFCSGKAALWLTLKSRQLNPKLCFVDWHSFLRENRRNPISSSAIKRRAPRGNSHIFGRVGFLSGGGRVRYSKVELVKFLSALEADPGLVDYLLKRVEK